MIVLSMLVSIFPLNAITAFADDGRLTDGSTKADIIYAMEQGEVKECGTHKELLKKNGLYQKMWTTQQRLERYGKGGVNV